MLVLSFDQRFGMPGSVTLRSYDELHKFSRLKVSFNDQVLE